MCPWYVFEVFFRYLFRLTNLCLASHSRDITNSVVPDQTPQNTVWSGFALFALTTGIFTKRGNKKKVRHLIYWKRTALGNMNEVAVSFHIPQKQIQSDRVLCSIFCFVVFHWLNLSDYLKLRRLSNTFSRRRFKIFFLFFPEKRFWQFMQIVSSGDNLHKFSNPIFRDQNTVYMNS